MPTSHLHPILCEVSEQVFTLHESIRKLELIEENLQHAAPEDIHHWNAMLHAIMGAEHQRIRQAFAQLNRLSGFPMEGIV